MGSHKQKYNIFRSFAIAKRNALHNMKHKLDYGNPVKQFPVVYNNLSFFALVIHCFLQQCRRVEEQSNVSFLDEKEI